MERIKTNKYALILFVISLVILALGVIGIIVSFAGMGATAEILRRELAKQTTDEALVNQVVQITIVVSYIVIFVSAILLLFEVLCGLKCSMYGRWRVGAIVFGVLLVIAYVSNALMLRSWLYWIDVAVGVLYLIGAIMCKPDSKEAIAN